MDEREEQAQETFATLRNAIYALAEMGVERDDLESRIEQALDEAFEA